MGKGGWMGFDSWLGLGGSFFCLDTTMFFDDEKRIFVGTWKNFGMKWFEICCFARGYLKFLEQKGNFQSLV